jgi:predicted nucleotidyltransferase
MASKKDPVAIAEEFATALRGVFSSDLQALLLVGSAVRGDFVPGKSDVNTLVILTPDGMDWLEKAHPVIKSWRKKGLAVPHFMMPDAITNGLDSYPLEFLDFKTFHKVIIGPDVLSEVEIPPQSLRLQIERELRGKLFLLRQVFASEAGQPKNLKAVLGRAVSVFTAVFQGILELGKRPIPSDRRQLFKEAAAFAGFSDKVFTHLLDVKKGKSDKNLRVIFKDLLKELTELVSWADSFEISK